MFNKTDGFSSRPSHPKDRGGRNGRILVIEDEALVREDIVDELKDAGYEVIEAANGKEGLEMILARHPDLVLCDVSMPAMSGHELLDRLRGDHPELSNTPFIFLTALTARDDVIRGKGLGSDDYLFKPIDFDLMLTSVRSRLGQAARINRLRQADLDQLRQRIFHLLPHELRTPLNHIIGFSDIMKSQTFGPLGSEHYTDYAAQINESGRALLEMIENVLLMLDVTAGNVSPTDEDCDVGRLVEKCLSELAAPIERAKLTVNCNVPPNLPAYRGARDLLFRALKALLANAVKFSNVGGAIYINVVATENNGLQVRIADAGIGIAPANMERVWEPFWQPEDPMTRTHQGAGLGLPLVRTLVDAMGGEIGIESDLGKGTTVSLSFPERLAA